MRHHPYERKQSDKQIVNPYQRKNSDQQQKVNRDSEVRQIVDRDSEFRRITQKRHICDYCQVTFDSKFLQSDDLMSLCNRRNDQVDDLRVLCPTCHTIKTINDHFLMNVKTSGT